MKRKLPPIKDRARQAGKQAVAMRLPHQILDFVDAVTEAEGRETRQETIEEILRREMIRAQQGSLPPQGG